MKDSISFSARQARESQNFRPSRKAENRPILAFLYPPACLPFYVKATRSLIGFIKKTKSFYLISRQAGPENGRATAPFKQKNMLDFRRIYLIKKS